MIVNQLRARFRLAEPVTRELAEQFQGTFLHYRAIRDEFFAKLPAHLHASELVSLVNVDLKARLFHGPFCEQIQDALRSLRRTLIRLEDLRLIHPGFPGAVNDLERLMRLGERAEALYQRHWEYYRYPTHLNEESLTGLLLEVHRLCGDWDEYFAQFTAVQALVDELSGQGPSPGTAALRVAYTQAPPLHFSVGMLRGLMDFLESGYAFVAALYDVDTALAPLMLLQVDVADPVELVVAVPAETEPAYAAFLQYLFLKDMLKREALLKYVFEAVGKHFGAGGRVDAGRFQKDLAAKLKALPETGRFVISGRSFPDDQIAVLHELTATMDRHHIDASALLGGEKAKPGRKGKSASADPPKPVQEPLRPAPEPLPGKPDRRPPGTPVPPSAPAPASGHPPQPPPFPAARLNPHSATRSAPADPPQPRQHLRILTERLTD